MIVDEIGGVTLLGAGEVNTHVLAEALTLAPILVAADGGARLALDLGHMPAAVIGDLDSIDGVVADRIPAERLHKISEQDTTDFDKCLRSIRAQVIIGVGFAGGRLDHELAAYNALVRHADRPCILIGGADICLHVQRLALDIPAGTRLSLFPMAPVTGRSQGLRWPIEGLQFSPSGRIGTSNEVTGPVRLDFDQPGMLAILPRACLGAAFAALSAWPRVPGQ